jgi:hypothetical protein
VATRFENDDKGYLGWLRANPRGFVLNVRKHADPDYVVLHRADCPSISTENRTEGAYTGGSYRKICSTELRDLEQAARLEGRSDGSFSHRHSRCLK